MPVNGSETLLGLSDEALHAFFAILFTLIISVFLRNLVAARRARLQLRDTKAALVMQEEISDAHCMISITDANGKITFANAHFLKATGYSEFETIGSPISRFYGGLDCENRAAGIRSKVRANGLWAGETELRCKSGDLIWTHTTVKALLDKKGRVRSIISMRTDITETKRAQSDRQLRNIFDLLPDEVYVFRADSHYFTYMNQQALLKSGIEGLEVPTKKLEGTQSFLSSPAFLDVVVELSHSGSTFQMIRQEDGDRVVEISIQLLHGEGEADLVFVMARDITVHVQTERAKSEFVSTVSHELRTPLTSIKGSLGLLSGGVVGELPDRVHSIISMAQRNTDRLILLINDLLDLEKIAAGQMDFSPEPLDINDLVQDAVETNTGFALQFGVKIDMQLSPSRAVVSGNKERLMQVLTNLLSNAIKFSPKGQTVVVSVADMRDTYQVGVTDRGLGVPEELKSRIFERFSQAKASTQLAMASTGLGLSICKSIVERHHGSIDFVSNDQTGTTFYFDLPKLNAAIAA